jgi:hypothetical protein
MTRYAVVGHFCPTDETPQDGVPEDQWGRIDTDAHVKLFASEEDAEQALLWYPDGVIYEVNGTD